MDIQAINTLFKDVTDSVTGLKGYAFGWPSERVRSYDTENDTLIEYPRVFFAVPTYQRDVTRMQDLYSINLYFEALQGYDNEGEATLDTQLAQWSDLQSLVNQWIQEFKSRYLEREPDYLALTTNINVVLDSFAGMQRMVTLVLSFQVITKSDCA